MALVWTISLTLARNHFETEYQLRSSRKILAFSTIFNWTFLMTLPCQKLLD